MASAEFPCNICGSTESKVCSKCRSSAYCSIECQRADLPSHRLLCSEVASSTRPGPSYKRAILFPADTENPKLIWVECIEKVSRAGATVEYPKAAEHLYEETCMPEVMSVVYNYRRKKEMRNSLRLVFQAKNREDGMQPNESIQMAVGKLRLCIWRGPVVVMRNREKDPDLYDDITLQDYRQAIDHFFYYKLDMGYDGEKDIKGCTKKMQGVRINCLGDRYHYKMEKYTPVEVPGEHPVCEAPIALMSLRMGIALQVMSYPLNPKWKGTWIHGEYASDNQSATFMHLHTKPTSGWWGFAPPPWIDNVGSVVVVRLDRLPLTPEQIMALCDFFQFEMGQYFEDSMGGGDVHRTKEQVLEFLTRERFERSWNEMKEMMVAQKYMNWTEDSESPYETMDRMENSAALTL